MKTQIVGCSKTARAPVLAAARAQPLRTSAALRHNTLNAGLARPARIFSQRATRHAIISASVAAATTTPGSSITDTIAKVADAAVTAFPVFVLGAAALGLAQPASFDWFLPQYMSPALGITMLGMGLTLTFADFARVLKTPRRILSGFALQYTIMPLLAFTVSRLMGLPLDFAIGLILVGCCPGGTASNVVTSIAKADVPLSVAMTTASTLGAVVATPFLTQLLLGTLVPVDGIALLLSTLQVVLFPVLLGAAINQAFPKQIQRLAPLSALSAVLLIATICGSVIAQNAAAVTNAGARLLLAVGALHAGGFALGYGLSKLLKMPEVVARTNSIEVGMQNSALGALLATAHFSANPLAAVPCAISACTHSVMGSLLAAFWRAQSDGASVEDIATAVAAVGEVVAERDVEVRRAEVQSWISQWRLKTGVTTAAADIVADASKYSAEQLAFLERKKQDLVARKSA